jgi:hypothetical protein
MQNLLRQNADRTVSKIGYVKAGRIGGHRECRDTNIEVSDTLDDWLSTFAAMLGAARSVAMSIENFQRGKPPGVGGECCPILCLRLWNVVCNRLVMQRNAELQLARMTLQTPPELCGTVARSFTAAACDYLGEIADTIVDVVEYPSASMPLRERTKHESDYVAANFGKLAARWPKNRLSAEEWFRLVELELSACPWLMNDQEKPISFSKPVTSTALRTECLKARLDFANGNTGEKAWRTFKDQMLSNGTFRLSDDSKPQGKLEVEANFLNRHGIKLP